MAIAEMIMRHVRTRRLMHGGSAEVRREGELGMRLTDEMIQEDDKRFKRQNLLAEFNYCGKEVPKRKSITNDDIRFYAWLCRSAYALLKEQAVRVLALDEIKEGEPYWFQMGHRLPTRAVICVYREDDTQKPYVTFTWQFGTFSWESEDYNKSWRCWTAKPTDEQIEAVKWDD